MFSQKARGFSLLELLIVLIIAGIVFNIALPSFSTFINNHERKSALHEVTSAFALARQYAVMNGAVVTLCPLDNHNACGRDWNGPIYVFLDPDNKRKVTTGETILRVITPEGKGHFIIRSLHRSFFQFKATGFIYSDLGNLTWCPESNDPKLAGQIIVSRGGRIRMARDTDGDGIAEDAKGRPLQC